ncbi:hypothetical protein MOQ_005650 [Trypanosoma cruzi marinkellei]|uniref:Uncharacterized protein n=1 Tax=Trypanosoma cruzi marinkellei TaxID=85056 RepID=K2MXL6_TRYCR|nr:hypothetical protein MOQ_005650 [Trypanosoma cruzi marinkellei]
MQIPEGCRGRSSPSLASSVSLQTEPASMRLFPTQMVELISEAREKGGFAGALRYCDLGPLLQRLGCAWDMERLDDCWYDMVRGRPASVVDDMPWAAQCLYEHLRGDPVVFPKPAQHSHVHGGGKDTLTPQQHETEGSARAACDSTSEACQTRPPQPQELKQQSGREKESQPAPQATIPSRRPRDLLSGKSHAATPRNVRFASPTLSSLRRSRSNSLPQQRKNTVERSPKRGRSISPKTTTGGVFHRLIEDAERRRNRASSPPTSNLETGTTNGGEGGGAVVLNKASMRAEDGVPLTKQTSRHMPFAAQSWNKPTKSYTAKLGPELASVDRLEAAAPTPHVERQEPAGPSAYVPPGYVEAVARLRRFAASRNHFQFVDSLRARTPVSTSMGILLERAPILRLPVSDPVEGNSAVDVRLATPARSHRLMVPQDVPYDDPSRVLIQDLLRGTRARSRE